MSADITNLSTESSTENVENQALETKPKIVEPIASSTDQEIHAQATNERVAGIDVDKQLGTQIEITPEGKTDLPEKVPEKLATALAEVPEALKKDAKENGVYDFVDKMPADDKKAWLESASPADKQAYEYYQHRVNAGDLGFLNQVSDATFDAYLKDEKDGEYSSSRIDAYMAYTARVNAGDYGFVDKLNPADQDKWLKEASPGDRKGYESYSSRVLAGDYSSLEKLYKASQEAPDSDAARAYADWLKTTPSEKEKRELSIYMDNVRNGNYSFVDHLNTEQKEAFLKDDNNRASYEKFKKQISEGDFYAIDQIGEEAYQDWRIRNPEEAKRYDTYQEKMLNNCLDFVDRMPPASREEWLSRPENAAYYKDYLDLKNKGDYSYLDYLSDEVLEEVLINASEEDYPKMRDYMFPPPTVVELPLDILPPDTDPALPAKNQAENHTPNNNNSGREIPAPNGPLKPPEAESTYNIELPKQVPTDSPVATDNTGAIVFGNPISDSAPAANQAPIPAPFPASESNYPPVTPPVVSLPETNIPNPPLQTARPQEIRDPFNPNRNRKPKDSLPPPVPAEHAPARAGTNNTYRPGSEIPNAPSGSNVIIGRPETSTHPSAPVVSNAENHHHPGAPVSDLPPLTNKPVVENQPPASGRLGEIQEQMANRRPLPGQPGRNQPTSNSESNQDNQEQKSNGPLKLREKTPDIIASTPEPAKPAPSSPAIESSLPPTTKPEAPGEHSHTQPENHQNNEVKPTAPIKDKPTLPGTVSPDTPRQDSAPTAGSPDKVAVPGSPKPNEPIAVPAQPSIPGQPLNPTDSKTKPDAGHDHKDQRENVSSQDIPKNMPPGNIPPTGTSNTGANLPPISADPVREEKKIPSVLERKQQAEAMRDASVKANEVAAAPPPPAEQKNQQPLPSPITGQAPAAAPPPGIAPPHSSSQTSPPAMEKPAVPKTENTNSPKPENVGNLPNQPAGTTTPGNSNKLEQQAPPQNKETATQPKLEQQPGPGTNNPTLSKDIPPQAKPEINTPKAEHAPAATENKVSPKPDSPERTEQNQRPNEPRQPQIAIDNKPAEQQKTTAPEPGAQNRTGNSLARDSAGTIVDGKSAPIALPGRQESLPGQQPQSTGKDIAQGSQSQSTGKDIAQGSQLQSASKDIAQGSQSQSTGKDIAQGSQSQSTGKDIAQGSQSQSAGKDITQGSQSQSTGKDIAQGSQSQSTGKETISGSAAGKESLSLNNPSKDPGQQASGRDGRQDSSGKDIAPASVRETVPARESRVDQQSIPRTASEPTKVQESSNPRGGGEKNPQFFQTEQTSSVKSNQGHLPAQAPSLPHVSTGKSEAANTTRNNEQDTVKESTKGLPIGLSQMGAQSSSHGQQTQAQTQKDPQNSTSSAPGSSVGLQPVNLPSLQITGSHDPAAGQNASSAGSTGKEPSPSATSGTTAAATAGPTGKEPTASATSGTTAAATAGPTGKEPSSSATCGTTAAATGLPGKEPTASATSGTTAAATGLPDKEPSSSATSGTTAAATGLPGKEPSSSATSSTTATATGLPDKGPPSSATTAAPGTALPQAHGATGAGSAGGSGSGSGGGTGGSGSGTASGGGTPGGSSNNTGSDTKGINEVSQETSQIIIQPPGGGIKFAASLTFNAIGEQAQERFIRNDTDTISSTANHPLPQPDVVPEQITNKTELHDSQPATTNPVSISSPQDKQEIHFYAPVTNDQGETVSALPIAPRENTVPLPAEPSLPNSSYNNLHVIDTSGPVNTPVPENAPANYPVSNSSPVIEAPREQALETHRETIAGIATGSSQHDYEQIIANASDRRNQALANEIAEAERQSPSQNINEPVIIKEPGGTSGETTGGSVGNTVNNSPDLEATGNSPVYSYPLDNTNSPPPVDIPAADGTWPVPPIPSSPPYANQDPETSNFPPPADIPAADGTWPVPPVPSSPPYANQDPETTVENLPPLPGPIHGPIDIAQPEQTPAVQDSYISPETSPTEPIPQEIGQGKESPAAKEPDQAGSTPETPPPVTAENPVAPNTTPSPQDTEKQPAISIAEQAARPEYIEQNHPAGTNRHPHEDNSFIAVQPSQLSTTHSGIILTEEQKQFLLEEVTRAFLEGQLWTAAGSTINQAPIESGRTDLASGNAYEPPAFSPSPEIAGTATPGNMQNMPVTAPFAPEALAITHNTIQHLISEGGLTNLISDYLQTVATDTIKEHIPVNDLAVQAETIAQGIQSLSPGDFVELIQNTFSHGDNPAMTGHAPTQGYSPVHKIEELIQSIFNPSTQREIDTQIEAAVFSPDPANTLSFDAGATSEDAQFGLSEEAPFGLPTGRLPNEDQIRYDKLEQERRQLQEEARKRDLEEKERREEETRRHLETILATARSQANRQPVSPALPQDLLLSSQKYIVLPGDTLESIAKKKLKDRRLAPLLYEINKNKIEVRIEAGRQLLVLTPKMILRLPSGIELQKYRAGAFRRPFRQFEYVQIPDKTSGEYKNTTGSYPLDAQTAKRRANIENILGPLNEEQTDLRIRYICRLGDSLRSVAMRHPALRNVTLWKLLAEVNALSVETDTKGIPLAELKRGQEIVLPMPQQIEAYLQAQTHSRPNTKQTAEKPISSSAGSLNSFVLPTKECPNCNRMTVETARLCPACTYIFQTSSCDPATESDSIANKTREIRSITTFPTSLENTVDPFSNSGDSDKEATMFLHKLEGTAEQAEGYSWLEARNVIVNLAENCRIVRYGNLGKNAIGFRSRLEIRLHDIWVPMREYQINEDFSWRYEYSRFGRKKSTKIDLPAKQAKEIAENDLQNNWAALSQDFFSPHMTKPDKDSGAD